DLDDKMNEEDDDDDSNNDGDNAEEDDNDIETGNETLYQGGTLTLDGAYKAIKNFIIKSNLAVTHVLCLISLLLYLLPSGHNLTRLGIVHSLKKREFFLYETKCVRCYQQVDPSVGNCTIGCLLYGKPRTTDGITELCYGNLVERIKCITRRNLSLILNYPKHAHVLLPNDVINGSVYKQLHTNIKCNQLTLM
ncbi:unnamed protein product, partial [Didymodactylos carnosus]